MLKDNLHLVVVVDSNLDSVGILLVDLVVVKDTLLDLGVVVGNLLVSLVVVEGTFLIDLRLEEENYSVLLDVGEGSLLSVLQVVVVGLSLIHI